MAELDIKKHLLALCSELSGLGEMVKRAMDDPSSMVVHALFKAFGDTPCFYWGLVAAERMRGGDLLFIARKMVELCCETGKSTRELASVTCLPPGISSDYFIPGGVIDMNNGIAVACCGPDPDVAEIIAQMYLTALVGFKKKLMCDAKPEPTQPDNDKLYTVIRVEEGSESCAIAVVSLKGAVDNAAYFIHAESRNNPQRVSVSSHHVGERKEEHLVSSFTLKEGEQNPDIPAVVRFRIVPKLTL